MPIVVRVFGQGLSRELVAFDRAKEPITVVSDKIGFWDQAMARALQNPPPADHLVPKETNDHLRYHKELEDLWQNASSQQISNSASREGHRHFWPWCDTKGSDYPVLSSLYSARLLGSGKTAFEKIIEEIWPD